MSVFWFVLAAAAVALVTGTTAAHAADRHVATTGDDQGGANDCQAPATPCRTIGQALGQATSGDVIKVARGKYTENLVVTTSGVRTIRGGYDATFDEGTRDPARQQTSIVGGKTDRALTITAGAGVNVAVHLDGLVVEKSTATTGLPSVGLGGGGIAAVASGNGVLDLELSRVTVAKNTAERGGGLAVGKSGPSALTVTITDSRFEGNRAASADGGGLFAQHDAASSNVLALVLQRVIFAKNRASQQGGGLSVDARGGGADVLLENAILMGNQALLGGAMFLRSTTDPAMPAASLDFDVVNTTITRNKAEGDPGGLFVAASGVGGTATVTGRLLNTIVWGNQGGDFAQDLRVSESLNGSLSLELVTNDYGDLLESGSPAITLVGPQLNVDPKVTGKGRLKSTSPVIDQGTCAGAPGTDIDGDPRPVGTDPCEVDLGADEFVP